MLYNGLHFIFRKPAVIMIVGVNGGGKTTSLGKENNSSVDSILCGAMTQKKSETTCSPFPLMSQKRLIFFRFNELKVSCVW